MKMMFNTHLKFFIWLMSLRTNIIIECMKKYVEEMYNE